MTASVDVMSSHADAVFAMTRSYTAVDSPETHPSGRSAVSAARIVAPSSPVSRSAYVSMHDCKRCVTVKLNNLSKPANPTLPTADVRSANVRMPITSAPSALNHALC